MIDFSCTRRRPSVLALAHSFVWLAVSCTFLATSITCDQQSAQHSAAQTGSASRLSAKSDPRFHEADALLQQGRIEEAKQKLQAELAKDPKSVEGYNLLGMVCVSLKDDDCALDAFQLALKLDPGSARTKNNLGNLYLSQHKTDLAEKEFRAVLRTAPANSDANYNLGLTLLAASHPAEAIQHLLRVSPATTASRLNLVSAYLAAGRAVEGIKAANDLSAQSPRDMQLHFTLGVILAAQKQYRAAQLELEKANSLQPETFEILYNLSQT